MEEGTGQREQQGQVWARVIARARRDGAFRQRLLAEPATVLQAEGLAVPEGIELRVVENTDRVRYLVLPREQAELADAELEQVAGGGAYIIDTGIYVHP